MTEQVAKSSGDVELQTQLLTRIAQIQETQLGDNDAAAATYQRVLKVAPHNLDAANAIEAIYERTDAYTKLVDVVLAQGRDRRRRRRAEGAAVQGGADLRGGARERRSRDRRLPAGPVDRRDRSRRRSTRSSGSYIRLERWEPLKDVYAKKAELAAAPDEKKQMLFVLGQVYDRELGSDARDRDLPERSSISIPTT